MTRRNQTELAVLGALSIEPLSGYALRAAITTTLGHFWSESFGQIYPTLSRLDEEGLVRKEPSTDKRGGPYALTEAGRERLAALLREPFEPTPPRNALLLRLFFGSTLGPEASIDLLRTARAEAGETLSRLTAVRHEVEAEPETPDRAYMLVTIAAGEAGARATIGWAEESMAALGALVQHDGAPASEAPASGAPASEAPASAPTDRAPAPRT